MNRKRFWNWKEPDEKEPRTLYLNGTIAEESWFEDDVTPELFREELYADEGDIVVWINSPGGDVIAGAQIYNMLLDYPGHVTIKIDGIAASAASVIAMAGDLLFMSPVSMMMIHNPMTVAIGDHVEMEKAIDMLASFKDSIINAYEKKTGLSRDELSLLMDAETWMDVGKAMELGFCDSVLQTASDYVYNESKPTMLFSRKAVTNSLLIKVKESHAVSANELVSRLDTIKNQWR
ncbi:head maturation protease, ClpP-related [Fundicoccus culcitae]|uniref:ATP-dependent Clp protease proteolytic subunit n=1 Tax=Fundicoccus culcitae TaxID=2969821 RepID=A0ABY5P930_9LACT|nr:head maturation protease, ClpP-related [Fundicoccus culcitae]UUX34875.1 Clp protease ClpP [Fundicoccus culcitae]